MPDGTVRLTWRPEALSGFALATAETVSAETVSRSDLFDVEDGDGPGMDEESVTDEPRNASNDEGKGQGAEEETLGRFEGVEQNA